MLPPSPQGKGSTMAETVLGQMFEDQWRYLSAVPQGLLNIAKWVAAGLIPGVIVLAMKAPPTDAKPGSDQGSLAGESQVVVPARPIERQGTTPQVGERFVDDAPLVQAPPEQQTFDTAPPAEPSQKSGFRLIDREVTQQIR